MKKLIVFSILMVVVKATCFSQFDEYASDTKKLLEINGTKKTLSYYSFYMMTQIKKTNPKLTDSIYSLLDSTIVRPSEILLLDKFVPVYQKHFTHAEIKELIAFYLTPIGKKAGDKSDLISQDSMTGIQSWTTEIAKKVQDYLKNMTPAKK